ncbi:GntR family transcriptional regulator [Microtetraspora sp. NBRC 13810]|uniref:aminotransferase-like domain-containing protein n=1 Tax=Microtetraspora sp. NBRC 13810 TaxID=3030990 RepID=UPI00255656C1|nr:PLP-dependent aminotransferase family protein [Microtetraspora sp. NBRC 13810]GLW08889.1 GntR family transcriptional regulator [Microtetraspora sp. NBRC 13810]
MTAADARGFTARLGEWRGERHGLAGALAEAIREAVLDGRVPVGSPLPAERALAEALGVSRGTVVAGLARLREDGWVRTRHGGGSVVRLPARLTEGTTPWSRDHGIGVDLTDAVTAAPHDAYREALARAAERLPPLLVGSGLPTPGLPVLRELLAERYTRQGLATRPEQILITSGARAALTLLMDRFHDRRRAVAVENPTFHGALALLRARRARHLTVPVTAQGWDLDRLAEVMASGQAAMAYLVPDFHNPTGALMSREDRGRVLDLARRHEVTVVADETMRDLDLRPDAERRACPPLGGAGIVVVGSVGKMFWSGLRVGWIRAATAGQVRELQLNPLQTQLSPPPLEQLVAHELLQDAERVLAGRRALLRAQRDHLSALLTGSDEWTHTVPAGGLTLWLRLRRPSAEPLVRQAARLGLTLAPGPNFSADRTHARYLRLPFTPSADVLDRAVALLREAAAACP